MKERQELIDKKEVMSIIWTIPRKEFFVYKISYSHQVLLSIIKGFADCFA